MASTAHNLKDVIKAASPEIRDLVNSFHNAQESGLSIDKSTRLANVGFDVDQEIAIEHTEGTTTDQAIICVICLELVAEEAVALPCRHNYFHFTCLATWLQQNRACPLCKVEVSSVRYHDAKLQSSSVFHLPTSIPSQSSQSSRGHHRQRVHRRPGHRSHYAPRIPESTADDQELQIRRRVYEHQLYSLYVGNNRISRYRNITPALIRSDLTLIPRAKRWIRRELRALDPFEQFAVIHRSTRVMSRSTEFRNNEFLLEYIIAILKHIDLKGSAGQAEVLLSEHLGSGNARIFLHELENWLRSPFERLDEWDNYVQYTEV